MAKGRIELTQVFLHGLNARGLARADRARKQVHARATFIEDILDGLQVLATVNIFKLLRHGGLRKKTDIDMLALIGAVAQRVRLQTALNRSITHHGQKVAGVWDTAFLLTGVTRAVHSL